MGAAARTGWLGAAMLLGLSGCRGEATGSGGTGGSDDGGMTGSATNGDPDPCVGLECMPCAGETPEAEQCADSPDVDGTCCASGDPLLQIGDASGSEVVDTITTGRFTVGCGGFGAVVSNVEDPTAPVTIGTASSRCQNAAFGPLLPSGEQLLYVTHHGDSWVESPGLHTFVLSADGTTMTAGDSETDANVLYEGLTVAQRTLYVTAHARGLLVYSLDDAGTPTRAAEVGGLSNAVEVASDGERLYVADREQGVVVLSLADPLAPAHVSAIETNGIPRDIDVDAGRIYVALGSAGVEVFEDDGAGVLTRVGHIDADGAVQQVDAEGDVVAVAAWSHAALYDTATLGLLATERTRPTPQFEQDLGVAVYEDLIFVGEWESVHVLRHQPGVIAPDLHIEQELIEFDEAVSDSQVVVARNRGALPLNISEASILDERFAVDLPPTTLEPGEAHAFEIAFTAGAALGAAQLQIVSDDPDDDQSPHVIPITAAESNRLDIGDPIGADFGFLDLEGTGQVENLEGNVVVLAYFALF